MSEAGLPSSSPMSVLVLGGTGWLGGEVARIAHQRGHHVTCLARGVSGTVPQGVDLVRADRWRAGAYGSVARRDWDAVVEVSWQPEHVHGAVSALGDRVRHWVYVSSLSVYADDRTPGADETAPVHEPYADGGAATIESYGPAKVACENAVRALGDGRVLTARAGLIVGYGDPSDRFGYWPARVAQAVGDRVEVLAPPLDAPVQVVDVQDLAAWLVRGAEQGTAGVFNAMGDVRGFGEVLAACAEAARTRPRPVPMDDGWLLAHGVEPWMGAEALPLWVPRADYAGFLGRSNAAARRAGLELRPLIDTATAALAWERTLGLDRRRRAGLSPGRERELLAQAG